MFGTSSITYSVPETAKYLLQIQRTSIGMDEWFRKFDDSFETLTNYPPHNLVKESSSDFRLELALAGYKGEDIRVSTEGNVLTVDVAEDGKTKDTTQYLHNGIAKRRVKRTWTLSDDVVVGHVSFVDGLLTVKLNRVIPEHQKRKVYEIVSGVHEGNKNDFLSDGTGAHCD
jgi:molecular chaperone IbpA